MMQGTVLDNDDAHRSIAEAAVFWTESFLHQALTDVADFVHQNSAANQ